MSKPILGIIGSIGAGKSLIASELARHGGYLITADALGHEGLRNPEIREKVLARWGDQVLKADGDIDRRKLGAIVFSAPAELRALEAVQFPFIGQRVREEIAKGEADPAVRYIVLDAAVLLEAGWKNECDRILFVDAPRTMRLERLCRNRHWTDDELDKRERSQMSLDEKRQSADAVLVNAGSVSDAAAQVREVLEKWNLLPETASP
jgi:dephospho-CoA kinase